VAVQAFGAGAFRADGASGRIVGGVTEHKPPGLRFESWVERQIREAQDRGEFDDLAGSGKPIADLTGTYDPMWWVKRVVRREHVRLLPPVLALRKEAEDLVRGLADAPTEQSVRDRVTDYNARVAAVLRRPQDGPLLAVPRRLDVDEAVAEWSRRRPPPPPPPPAQ
jgi:hypothetical protein